MAGDNWGSRSYPCTRLFATIAGFCLVWLTEQVDLSYEHSKSSSQENRKSMLATAKLDLLEEQYTTIGAATVDETVATLRSATKPAKRKINFIFIRGERHSGTNLLREIITKACPSFPTTYPCEDYLGPIKGTCKPRPAPWLANNERVADSRYGWKHSIFNGDMKDGHLLIVIFRNVSSWIPKMRKHTYEYYIDDKLDKVDMPEFLNLSWTRRTVDNPTGTKFDNQLDTQHWKNIFEMRYGKYSSWFNYAKTHPDKALYIRYEDLAKNNSLILDMLHDRFDIPCASHVKITCLAKHGKCGENTSFGLFKKETSYTWNPDNWSTVLRNVNVSFEQELDYNLIN